MGVEFYLLGVDPTRLSDFQSMLRSSPVVDHQDVHELAIRIGIKHQYDIDDCAIESVGDSVFSLAIEYARSKEWNLGKMYHRNGLGCIFKDVPLIRKVPIGSFNGSDVNIERFLGIVTDLCVIGWSAEAVERWAPVVEEFDRVERIASLLDGPVSILDRLTGRRARLERAVQTWMSEINLATWMDIVEAVRYVRTRRHHLCMMSVA